jgi:hypothetical protein
MGVQEGDAVLFALYFADYRIKWRKIETIYITWSGNYKKHKQMWSNYMIFGNSEKKDLPLEDEYISEAGKCKYLGILF